MSDGPIEALPAEIAALLSLERDAYPDQLAMKQAVFARVERAVMLSVPLAGAAGRAGAGAARAGADAAAAAAKGSMVGKLVTVGVAAFAMGGFAGAIGATAATRHATVASPAVSVAVAPPVSGASGAGASGSEAQPKGGLPSEDRSPWIPVPTQSVAEASPVTPPGTASHAPATTPSASDVGSSATGGTSASSAIGDLSREREIVDVARAALARSRPDDAIVAAEKHAERWPRGALAEEREVVLVQALVMAGRRREAEQRAAQFRRTFPRSMFMPAIDAALERDAASSPQ